jgi:uridylate kinase
MNCNLFSFTVRLCRVLSERRHGRHPRLMVYDGVARDAWGRQGTSGKPMTGPGETKFPPKFSAWRRIVVKLSGEALMGARSHGLDQDILARIAADLQEVAARGVEVAVVAGGGNFFRGIEGADKGIERARADSIGMLATVMNALALEYAIEKQGQAARTLSALPMPALCEAYSRQAALHHLGKGRIVVLAGGTGNPFFTTDTGAALRGAELSCDLIMKATQVDGVYSADPKRDPAAVRYDRLTHDEAIGRNLAVMDTAAFALARENEIPIIVFSIRQPGAILAALEGRGKATLVSPS